MSAIPPELASLLGAAAAHLARVAWAALRNGSAKKKMGPVREVDDMADSARFAAIDAKIAQLDLRYGAQTQKLVERIAELEQHLSEAHEDLKRSTIALGRHQLAVEYLYDELQLLRRDSGMPPLPPLDTYLTRAERVDTPFPPLRRQM